MIGHGAMLCAAALSLGLRFAAVLAVLWLAWQLFAFALETVTALGSNAPNLALRLFLQCAQEANNCQYETIAYEFVTQVGYVPARVRPPVALPRFRPVPPLESTLVDPHGASSLAALFGQGRFLPAGPTWATVGTQAFILYEDEISDSKVQEVSPWHRPRGRPHSHIRPWPAAAPPDA